MIPKSKNRFLEKIMLNQKNCAVSREPPADAHIPANSRMIL
jgi:hypothetical protein